MAKQIPYNLVGDVCPALMAGAMEKARVSYFLNGKGIWRYPAIMVIDDEADSDQCPMRHSVHDNHPLQPDRRD